MRWGQQPLKSRHFTDQGAFLLLYISLVDAGIALIHTKEYTKALELFRRLTEEHPHHAAYSKQVMTLENKLREDAKTTTSSSIEVTSLSNGTS